MTQEIIPKLEERKLLLEKEIKDKRSELSEHSRRVSETQILLLELGGELNGVKKMINSLKED